MVNGETYRAVVVVIRPQAYAVGDTTPVYNANHRLEPLTKWSVVVATPCSSSVTPTPPSFRVIWTIPVAGAPSIVTVAVRVTSSPGSPTAALGASATKMVEARAGEAGRPRAATAAIEAMTAKRRTGRGGVGIAASPVLTTHRRRAPDDTGPRRRTST